MSKPWKVLEVLQQGSLVGKDAGRMIKLAVQFPWGVEVREFAPTMSNEDIRRTRDSFVATHTPAGEKRDRQAVSPTDFNTES